MPQLKPLQETMLSETRKAFTRSKRVILQAATGSGKTIVAAAIIKKALEKGKTALFICDRIVLVEQTSDVFRRYDIPHGVIQGQNERYDISQPVQVCSIQTLKFRGTPETDLIIIDECHVLHSAHIDILKQYPDAYVLGLTATPYTKGLGKHFDFHIQPASIKKLTEEKYLVPYDVYGPTVADLSKLKVVAGEYTEQSLSDTYDKADIIGSVVDVWKKHASRMKTIIFGVNVAHIKHMVNQFQLSGITADQVNYRVKKEERDDIFRDFSNNDTQVLCSVEVLTKGFDSPAVECCVLAVATKSITKLTQTIGRALRTSEGKTKALVIDLGGNFERLGFPEDYILYDLDGGKKPKKKEYEKKEKLPHACPSCDFLIPSGVAVCPACGFKAEKKSEVVEAEGDVELLQRKAKKEYTVSERQAFLAGLNSYAAKTGKQMHWKGFFGWAIHTYSDRFGCSPSNRMDWAARGPITEEIANYITYKNIRYAKSQGKTLLIRRPNENT
jgi:superfamily II DNA or RNA helicase